MEKYRKRDVDRERGERERESDGEIQNEIEREIVMKR